MSPIPMVGLSNTGYTPIIYVINLSTGKVESTMKSKRKYLPQKTKELSETFNKDIPLCGDVLMKFNHNTSIQGLAEHESELFKLYFHTSLIHSTSLTYKIDDLDAVDTDDSLSYRHEQVYSPQFSVTLILEEVLEKEAISGDSNNVKNDIENGTGNDMQIIINEEAGTEQLVMKYDDNLENIISEETKKEIEELPENHDLLLTPKNNVDNDKVSCDNVGSLVVPNSEGDVEGSSVTDVPVPSHVSVEGMGGLESDVGRGEIGLKLPQSGETVSESGGSGEVGKDLKEN